MHAHRPIGWLRPLLSLAALVGVLSLAACGGGGGSPNNPYQPGGGALTVTPAGASGYSGVPFALAISGGTPPYTAASSDPALLAVPANASGTSLVVLPAAVTAATPVQYTITDALGRQLTSTFTINPMLFLPATITITGNTNCASSGATLCSGQDGGASVTVTGPGGGPLANRSVRFDVVQGNFTISPPGGSPATSLVVNTDQNGTASVRLLVDVSAPTQIATLRATDVTSGSTVVGQFTIAQYTDGSSVLTVLPTGTTTFTGPDSATCAVGGQATFYIFGGTPPYSVQTNFPQAITIRGAPVQKSGSGFTITTTGVCVTNLNFIIADSTGRVATSPTVDNQVGTAAPQPPALVVTPSSLSGTCSAGSTFTFLASGGTGSYTNAVNPEAGATGTATVSPSGANVAVSFTTAATGVFDVNVSSGSQVVLAKLTCN